MRHALLAKRLFLAAGVVAALAAARPSAAAVTAVATFAEARANSAWSLPQLSSDPQHSEEDARAIDPAGSADAGSSADFGGPFKGFASLRGTANNGTEFNPALEAESSTVQFNEYRVQSATLPFGTPVEGRLELHFSGTLDRRQPAGAEFASRQLVAEVDAIVELVGVGYYAGGAVLSVANGSYGHGEWEGQVAFTDHGDGHRSAVVDIDDTLTFRTTVGATFQFQFDLVAHAQAVTGTNLAADVDFFDADAATFSFSGPEGVTFAVVPEPAAASLLLAAGVLALTRRRR